MKKRFFESNYDAKSKINSKQNKNLNSTFNVKNSISLISSILNNLKLNNLQPISQQLDTLDNIRNSDKIKFNSQLIGGDLQYGGDLLPKVQKILKNSKTKKDNITYLNKNMESLSNRLNFVVNTNKLLHKLRTNIEWIVNKIERCKGDDASLEDVCEDIPQEDMEALGKAIESIEDQLKTNEDDIQTANYLDQISKYISSFIL